MSTMHHDPHDPALRRPDLFGEALERLDELEGSKEGDTDPAEICAALDKWLREEPQNALSFSQHLVMRAAWRAQVRRHAGDPVFGIAAQQALGAQVRRKRSRERLLSLVTQAAALLWPLYYFPMPLWDRVLGFAASAFLLVLWRRDAALGLPAPENRLSP